MWMVLFYFIFSQSGQAVQGLLEHKLRNACMRGRVSLMDSAATFILDHLYLASVFVSQANGIEIVNRRFLHPSWMLRFNSWLSLGRKG